MAVQVTKQLQELSQYDHIAFTSRNGIHAVMDLLARLHGSQATALQALQDSKLQCWALGADADALRQLGASHVQTPAEVCPSCESFSLLPVIITAWLSATRVYKHFVSSAMLALIAKAKCAVHNAFILLLRNLPGLTCTIYSASAVCLEQELCLAVLACLLAMHRR